MRPITFLLVSFFLCLLIGLTGNTAIAQTNLLANSGFEQPYSGGYHRNTASGWSAWAGAGDADFYPEQYGSVYSGANSQALLALGVIRDSSPLDVAVWQTAQNIPVGSRVRANAWVSVWISGAPDPANTGARLSIGIDPNGGTNPYDGDVVWSGIGAQSGAQTGSGWTAPYTQIAVEAVTTGAAATVFLRWQQTWGGNEQRAYFDNAALVILQSGGGTAPTAAGGSQPTAVPTAVLPVATGIPGATTTYIVQRGDTLYRIALRYSVTVNAIVAANSLTNPNLIHAGQTLIIPAAGATLPTPVATTPASTTTCASPYIVQAGDNLYRIALRCGKTVAAIAAANSLANPNLIYIGQTLIVP